MLTKSRLLAAILAGSVIVAGAAGCEGKQGTDRWTTTENTNVDIDWDKVNEAYKTAEGPEDLEKKINEIYEGDEIISIAVKDNDAKTQVVTGFFDKNKSGSVDEGEKIFTIQRNITGEGSGNIQTTGYGHYAGHTSMLDIAGGMILGSMIMNAFSPRYVPVYASAPYQTSAARANNIAQTRQSYRQANPSRFSKPSKTTGRSYGGSTGRSGGGGRGGGRFGLARKGRSTRPARLTA
jgi:hypothetical protein